MDASEVLWLIFVIPMVSLLVGIAGCTFYEIYTNIRDWIKYGSDNNKKLP